MGWIYAAFIWGYALCQLPGGILGKRFGPRLALASVGLIWIITTALTGWLPGHIFTTGSGIIASLLIVRFLVGVAHAPIYPIQAAVVERWFPVGHWALPNAVSSTGLTLGRRCCATIGGGGHGLLGMARLFLLVHPPWARAVYAVVVVCH